MRRATAIALGATISLVSLALVSVASFGLVFRSVFFVPASSPPPLAALVLVPVVGALGLIVAVVGVFLATRWSDWRAGLAVSVICQCTLVGIPVVLGITAWSGPDSLAPWMLGIALVGASVFGVPASIAILQAGRLARTDVAGKTERARRVFVTSRTRVGRPGPALGSYAPLVLHMASSPRMLAGGLAILVAPVVLLVALSGRMLLLFAAVFAAVGLLAQAAVISRAEETSYGGLLPADMGDLATLGARRGAVMDRRNGMRVIGMLSGAVVGFALALLATIVAISLEAVGVAVGSGVVAALLAMIVVVGGRRAAAARRRPAGWLQEQTGAEWVPTGTMREVKRALAEASVALGLPYPPGLQSVQAADVNMWVVGDREHAVIGITTGALEVMGTDELRAAFSSLMARVVSGGVVSPAAAALSELVFGDGHPLGGSLGYVQAADVRAALALRDVDALERALACSIGYATRVPGLGGAFAAHLWLWPRAADEVPESELERIELLRAVDPGRVTLVPEHGIRPRISPGDRTQPGTPAAWVVCDVCGKENTVVVDRCVQCAAALDGEGCDG